MSKMSLIKLTRQMVAIVDPEYHGELSKYKWYATPGGNTFYAATELSGRKKVIMHRVIIGVSDPNVFVDHINGNGLDNRLKNLRVCTNSQNQMNRGISKLSTSGYKGAYWNKRDNRWRAQLRLNGKAIHLGHFDTAIEAARAYDTAAKIHYKEFANLNFPNE